MRPTDSRTAPAALAASAPIAASTPLTVVLGMTGRPDRLDAKEMLAYQHSGFSVDAGVCIQSQDRAGLERLLRYCARPPFAMDRDCASEALIWSTTAPSRRPVANKLTWCSRRWN
jgi:hypothetical protein